VRTFLTFAMPCKHAHCAQALQTFSQLLAQVPDGSPPPTLPAELANVDQLRVILDALPDYHMEDEQPSYVLAIPCRPILVGLSAILPGLPALSRVNWGALLTASAGEGAPG
jgi:hypothetical protein